MNIRTNEYVPSGYLKLNYITSTNKNYIQSYNSKINQSIQNIQDFPK